MTRGARALVVTPDIARQKTDLAPDERLEEACGLALAIGLVVADAQVLPVRQVRPNTLFGSGQVDNLAIACEQHEAELVVVDGALSPIQQRNLEDRLKRKVIDRTGLILEIFGERAATAEGRLQVELAHLDYQQSRLVRSWTHLERQRGGFGFLGGPGETQIEADRRQIRQRMARLRRELDQVRRTRALHRERRGRAPWPVIALVGYTNAGKSTLFNRLTGADVMAQDLLFATLDPTMRSIGLPDLEKAILSDTVGFISDLPTQLVAAFRATLEEVTGADVIVHVRDIANPASGAQKRQVLEVLRELGIDTQGAGDGSDGDAAHAAPPILEAWNKIDLLPAEKAVELREVAAGDEMIVALSAHTGEGVDDLATTISNLLTRNAKTYDFTLPAKAGRKIAWLHAHGEVIAERQVAEDAGGHAGEGPQVHMTVRLDAKTRGQFETL